MLETKIPSLPLLVKVKKLNDSAVMPSRADSGSAGWDLTACTERFFAEGPINYVEYDSQLAFEIPPGHVGLVFPRSSITSNTTLMLGNAVAVIDSSYRGSVKLRFKSVSQAGKKYKIGERIGQLIIVPYPEIVFDEVQELSDTSRNEGSFGSSGK